MGNGRKRTPDVAKARPWAAEAMSPASTIPARRVEEADSASGAATGSQGHAQRGAPVEFCERVHVLRFQTLDAAAPQRDQAVQLLLADPPLVVSTTGQRLGVISDPQATAILQCLIDCYAISGRIVALDPYDNYGEVRVTGRLA